MADTITAVLENPRPRLRYSVGTDAKMGLLLSKLLPAALFERAILKHTGLDGRVFARRGASDPATGAGL